MTIYHIDTDMGVDDGLALLLVSRIPGSSIAALSTVFGDVPVEVATRNARLFRYLLRDKVKFEIFAGAERASDGFKYSAVDVFDEDGLGLAASEFLGAMSSDPLAEAGPITPIPKPDSSAGRGPITIIGIGPATNVPKLVAYYGIKNVERIVLMSGSFFDAGNITADAEFNAYCDPPALQSTLGLGIPVIMVPLDICRKVVLCRSTVRSYGENSPSPLTRLVVNSHMRYMDYCKEREGIDGCFPHDALAVLAAAEPNHFYRLRGRVHIDGSKQHRGKTSFFPDSSSHIEIVTGGRLKWVRDRFRSLQFD
jgi:inosine-uridine nucleoside N-ribohydrolase